MPLAAPIQNQKAKGQPAARRYQRFRDNHGRRWGAVIENKTGDPVGPIEPIGIRNEAMWTAPWLPAQKYLKLARDEDGVIEVGRLQIDYETMLRDALLEQKDYDEWMEFVAQALYGESAGEKIEKPTPQLLRYMRNRPQAPEMIVAAMEGDRWILGFEKGTCPEYLLPYFKPAKVVGGVPELELDPEFAKGLEAMKAAYAEARVKNTKREDARASLGSVAERAREDADREAEVAVRETVERVRSDRARGSR